MNDVIDALSSIDVSALSYSEWVQVGMALKTAGYPVEVWDNWSRDDCRYKDGECERKWGSFKGCAVPVTVLSIFKMAQNMSPASKSNTCFDWNDSIDYDGTDDVSSGMTPVQQLKLYLTTLFYPEEYVGYVSNDAYLDGDKWSPLRGVYYRTCGELLESIDKYPDDLGATIGDWKPGAGAWIRFNPLDGNGASDINVADFRYALVESDHMSVREQEQIYRELQLPIVALVFSGKRSIHAVVKVEANNIEQYRERVSFLYSYLEKNGVTVDIQNKNPSKLSRLPGATRNGILQELIAVNIGKASWDEWYDFVNGNDTDFPKEREFTGRGEPMPMAPALIDGILRCGHKMIIAGASKAGKSFLLLGLALCLCTGTPWLGFSCRKSKVLYINLEIDEASLDNRLYAIKETMGLGDIEGLSVLTLRGHAVPMDKLAEIIIRRYESKDYDAIIVDPIYKVITGDENSASDMAFFTNQFDRITASLGCSVIYCHHHSKGMQGGKKAIDRSSGSGVFARDADAILDLCELDISGEIKNFIADENTTAWQVSATLREFAPVKPFNIWFDYPVHRIDDKGYLDTAYVEGSAEANLAKSSKRTSDTEKLSYLNTSFEACCENGCATVNDMASYIGKDTKTIRRYVERFSDLFECKNGIVFKKTTT